MRINFPNFFEIKGKEKEKEKEKDFHEFQSYIAQIYIYTRIPIQIENLPWKKKKKKEKKRRNHLIESKLRWKKKEEEKTILTQPNLANYNQCRKSLSISSVG